MVAGILGSATTRWRGSGLLSLHVLLILKFLEDRLCVCLKPVGVRSLIDKLLKEVGSLLILCLVIVHRADVEQKHSGFDQRIGIVRVSSQDLLIFGQRLIEG